MPSNFPGGFDDRTISGNPARTDLVSRIDDIYDMVEKIQQVLGLNPQGGFASVSERLDNLTFGDLADVSVAAASNGQVPTMFAGTWVNGDGIVQHESKTDAQDPHANAKYLIMLGGGRRNTVGTSPHSSPAVNDTWDDTNP